MSFPALTWELVDREQTLLNTLDKRRAGANVTITLNDARRAECPLSLEDPALPAGLSPMDTLIRCTVEGWTNPLAVTRILVPESSQTADQEGTTLRGIDPFNHLERENDLWQDIPPIGGINFRTGLAFNEDQSQIMWDVIAAVEAQGAATGIVEGTLAGASVTRQIWFSAYKSAGDILVYVSELNGGPDFELAPVLATDGTLAHFNTYYPRQGSDKTATVVFEHGFGGQSASEFSDAPDGGQLINKAVSIGAATPDDPDTGVSGSHGNPTVVAEHDASIAQYGTFMQVNTVEDRDFASVEAHARGIVAASAYPAAIFSFKPDEDAEFDFAPPSEGGDYWMGDTVAVDAVLPYMANDSSPLRRKGRIVQAALTEVDDESGAVDIELICSAENVSSGITGASYNLVLRENDI